MNYSVLNGNNIDVLKTISDNTLDGCITDPPYGMGMEEWDYAVPTVELWQEVYRVLKPGAFCLSFCSPELYHRMAVNLEDGGFEIKDMVNWIITTKMAKRNRLKPAHEPIAVAQKPFKGSIKNNVEKWGTGEIIIKGNKIPWEGKPPTGWVKDGHLRRTFGKDGNTTGNAKDNGTVDADPSGRYPSNVIGLFDNDDHQKYFYAPRVSRKEKGEDNDHPTCKPIDLMSFLVNVYVPTGGHVLDPFNGSGSTGIATVKSGRDYTGIELSKHYCELSEARISEYTKLV